MAGTRILQLVTQWRLSVVNLVDNQYMIFCDLDAKWTYKCRNGYIVKEVYALNWQMALRYILM